MKMGQGAQEPIGKSCIAGTNDKMEGTTKYVSNTDELNIALADLKGGDILVLGDGIYSGGINTVNGRNGTEYAPVSIKAENTGMAEITGEAGFHFLNCSHIGLEGIKFTGSGKKYEDEHYRVVLFESCSHMKIRGCHFKPEEAGDNTTIVLIQGENSHHNYVGCNLFDGKHKSGLMLDITGGISQASMYDTIEYNHFRNNEPWIENGKETVRIGLSNLSESSSFSVIQYNLFENCGGEPEIISIKACDTEVRYNTFRNSRGQVVLRHGDRSRVHGNYFIVDNGEEDAGGVRVYGYDHKIYNNYMQGLTASAIQIDKGNAHTTGKLTAHWTPRRIEICFNTLIDCRENIEIGKRYVYNPENCVIANNIITGSTGCLVNEYDTPVNFVYMGNVVYPKGDAVACNTAKSREEILVADPQLVKPGSVYRLSETSPAIDKATGEFGYVVEDIDRQSRGGAKDIGAEEYERDKKIVGPIKPSGVGLNALDVHHGDV